MRSGFISKAARGSRRATHPQSPPPARGARAANSSPGCTAPPAASRSRGTEKGSRPGRGSGHRGLQARGDRVAIDRCDVEQEAEVLDPGDRGHPRRAGPQELAREVAGLDVEERGGTRGAHGQRVDEAFAGGVRGNVEQERRDGIPRDLGEPFERGGGVGVAEALVADLPLGSASQVGRQVAEVDQVARRGRRCGRFEGREPALRGRRAPRRAPGSPFSRAPRRSCAAAPGLPATRANRSTLRSW